MEAAELCQGSFSYFPFQGIIFFESTGREERASLDHRNLFLLEDGISTIKFLKGSILLIYSMKMVRQMICIKRFHTWGTNKSHPRPAMLIPNHGSIRLFISYHCHCTGNLDDVVFYLNEMRIFGIPPRYGTFVDLLHGFFKWHNPMVPGPQRVLRKFPHISE